jgi:ABC-type transporter Mla subunit MlaD
VRWRAAVAIGAAAIVVALVYALAGGVGGGGSDYRAAAVFDSAKGIVPGQLVKIAGARVGSVTGVKLEPGPTALIEFTVQRRFAPFRADASCQILPEGPISENYVECDPGSPSKPPLGPQHEAETKLPTVPVARTTDPVSLQDVLNVFSLPVDQRLAVLINELGVGTAGEGSDINAILRRANPALTQGDRVLSILNAQNQRIADAVTETNAVIGQLAGRSASVRSFVDRAAALTNTTAAYRGAIAAGVQRLPALLRELRTDLRPVDRVAVDGTPLLSDLRKAAPGLTQLTRTVPAFTKPGLPAVEALGAAARTGRTAVTAATPVVDELAKLASTAPAILQLADQLGASSRDTGAFEGGLRLLYSFATDAAGYDSTSHFITALIIPFPGCIANPGMAGCDHRYDSADQGSIPINDPSAGGQTTSALKRATATTLKPLLNYLLR